MHILNQDTMPYSRGMGFSSLRRWPGMALLGATAGFVFALSAWVLRSGPGWTGLLVFFGLMFIGRWEQRGWPGETVLRLGKYSPSGSALCGYLAAAAVAPLLGLDAEAVGWEGACGVTAAAWFMTGWKKWKMSGLNWFSTGTSGLLVAERAALGPPVLRALRRWIVSAPWLLLTIGAVGFAVEVAGVAFCFPMARSAYTVAVLLMLGATAVVLGYVEVEWALVLVALSWV
jgi:hypothetical protein